MNLEIDEFREIVDGEWPGGAIQGRKPNEDEMRRALQVMLTRQCIYSSTPGLGRTYELVRAYSSFFERFFGTLGYRLVVSLRDQMVALSVPKGDTRYDAVYERLRKDETIVLLALRILWEEALGSQDIGDGMLETTTGELVDRIRTVTKADPPEEARLLDILRMFQRQGAVRVGQRDRIEKVSPLTILPGVSVLVPDSYLEDLMLWAASPGGSVEAEAA
jgi:Domain of unknown function (DUF4194)